MNAWDENSDEYQAERQRGIASVVRMEQDAILKLDSLERRMHRMDKQMVLLSVYVKQLQRVVWGCGILVVGQALLIVTKLGH